MLAFSYYSSSAFTTHEGEGVAVQGDVFTGVENPYLKKSEWGWQVDPVGYRYFLNMLNDLYHVPLFDVENGLGAKDELVVEDGVERVHDPYRIAYLRDHIANLKAAIEEDGVDIFGYTTWGPIDLCAAAPARFPSATALSTWTWTTRARARSTAAARTSFTGTRR